MVHPEKLQEIKQNFIGQFLPKSKLKPISSVNPNIEERYRTELPVQKRTITTGKRKATAISKSAPKNTVHEPVKPVQQPLKLRNPPDPKVSKTQSVPHSNNNDPRLLKPAVPVSKSTISKPAVASVDKTALKTRKLSIVRPTVTNQPKKEPMTNNKTVTIPKYNNASSLPLGDSFIKPKETSKITKAVSKSNPKSILKQSPHKDKEMKGDVAKEKAVFNSIVTNIEKSLGAKKKTLPSPKKIVKPKTDVLGGDGVKEISKRTKKFNRSSSKSAKSLKYMDKSTSPKSISNVSFREIKHNDSLIISARKLQNATGVRKSLKPEFIKLYKRPTQTRSNVATDTNQLKSCMKKNWKETSAVGSLGKCIDRSVPTLNFGMHKAFGKALVK